MLLTTADNKKLFSHLGQFPPLRSQHLTWAAPGSIKIYQPHLLLSLTTDQRLEAGLVQADHSGPEDVHNKVSQLLCVLVALNNTIDEKTLVLNCVSSPDICEAWCC